jgi:hypothetical protein
MQTCIEMHKISLVQLDTLYLRRYSQAFSAHFQHNLTASCQLRRALSPTGVA